MRPAVMTVRNARLAAVAATAALTAAAFILPAKATVSTVQKHEVFAPKPEVRTASSNVSFH
ncbi:hypothetical protein C7441_12619 [Pseudaminobacter salicylatoxidans]|uniref:Uncharacterized protein n=2 Tax=Pseudaminobacter salicylatoxidans TaxID=93369 RepID=A0A316BLF4_PSESE|nr:hypothetical protein C7441_12619 [Pseudaminobacter salicylatoxidans]